MKILSSKIRTFLSSNKESVFCMVSFVVALLIGIFMYCNQLILWSGIVASLLVYWRLPMANIEIDNKKVQFAWACVNFAVFVMVCKLCSLEANDGYPRVSYVVGAFVALFVNGFLYTTLIPKLSYKMKLIDDEWGWEYDYHSNFRKTNRNGSIVSNIIYIGIISLVLFVEVKQKQNYLFEKEPFVIVDAWKKQTNRGKTVYVVETTKGVFEVSPQRYPEIENISSNTRIKVLCKDTYTSNGLNEFYRMEIKN